MKSSSGTKKLKAMERQFKGIWIPANIWLDKRLTPTEKVILSQLPDLIQDPYEDWGGEAYLPSNEECTEYLQVSRPTLSRALAKFKKLGIMKIYFNGRTRFVY